VSGVREYQHYMWPVILSNVFALSLILLSVMRPRAARSVAGWGFIAAGVANSVVIVRDPQSYVVGYGRLAWGIYKSVIYGPFATHPMLYVLLIAAGQLLAGALTLWGRRYQRLGLIGEIVFLAAIIPLGAGSAFPFSLLAIAALAVLYRQSLSWEVRHDETAGAGRRSLARSH
jgi:hypothetical protein